MLRRIQYLLFVIFLPFLSNGQEVSNIVSGYVPEIDKLEVQFDFDAPLANQTYRYKLFLQSSKTRRSIEIKQEHVQGLDLSAISVGIQKFFQIDLSKIQIQDGEYALVFESLDKQVKPNQDLVVKTVKKDTLQTKQVVAKEFKIKQKEKSKVELEDGVFDNYITIGVSPLDISGQQTSKTYSVQFGRLIGNFGYGLTVKYAIGDNINTAFETDNGFVSNYNPVGTYYKFNGDFKTDRFAIIPSVFLLITDRILVNVGAGYGKRSLYWGINEISFATNTLSNTNWAKNTQASQSGIELQGGITYLINKFNVHVGMNQLGLIKLKGNGSFSEITVGIGYNF